MKKIILIALIILITGFVHAQQQPRDIGEPSPELIGIESAQQQLKEVSVDKFEHDGFWRSSMSSDDGYVTSRLFEGNPPAYDPDRNPGGKRQIPEEEGLNLQDKFVLGTRVDFLRRGHSYFTIYPTRPIPIEGITKTISVWVAGRNFNHRLYILIQDFFGRNYEFFMGRLNFMGWQKMTVAIPPQGEDGISGVVQRNYHYHNQMGIKIMGFRIDCDPLEARGSYYIYFDDLRAFTDLFSENNRDPDDMIDGW
jgi:hypothetical protein